MALLIATLLVQNEPLTDALSFLVRHQGPRACACAPSRPGDAGRVVVALIAAAYSDLSADVHAGKKIGAVVGELLTGIVASQRDDGLFFPNDPTANAWMAFALTEIYSATGNKRWEDPARRAAEVIQGMPASDEDALFLQALVLRSAALDELIPKGPELPHAGSDASPLGIAKKDHRFVLGRDHTRKSHVGWRNGVSEVWLARQRKDACGAGSWEKSVEATSYLVTALGRWCWPCRTFGRKKD